MVKKFVCPDAEPVTRAEKTYSFDNDVADFEMPTSPPKKLRSAASAPVQIGMQHFSDNSELCGLPGTQDKVVVIMMVHKASPDYFSKYGGGNVWKVSEDSA